MKTKLCKRCGKDKPAVLFANDRSTPDGRAYYCKRCKDVGTKRWRRENMGHGVGKMPGVDLHSISIIARR